VTNYLSPEGAIRKQVCGPHTPWWCRHSCLPLSAQTKVADRIVRLSKRACYVAFSVPARLLNHQESVPEKCALRKFTIRSVNRSRVHNRCTANQLHAEIYFEVFPHAGRALRLATWRRSYTINVLWVELCGLHKL
jgi:hypothetical protein